MSAAAELWGAEWRPAGATGRLELPVTAGIRHGLVGGPLWIEPSGAGSVVVLRVEAARWSLAGKPVAVLLLAALGGAVTVLWPFFPRLLPAAPLGIVLALSAWFMVLSRLRSSGPHEFLATVAELAEEDAGEATPRGEP